MSERVYLPYYSDISDVVGLLSLKKAKLGGLSGLVSSMTVYNEILEKHVVVLITIVLTMVILIKKIL